MDLDADLKNVKVDDILSFFPMENPRDEQVLLIKQIRYAVEKGYKFIIVEAPTGIGKSPVAISICRWMGAGYICTNQKSLQEQYMKDFKNFATEVKGRNNFACKTEAFSLKEGDETVYCDEGTCTKIKGFKCPRKPQVLAQGENYYDQNEDRLPQFAGESARRGTLIWKTEKRNRCFYYNNKMRGLNAEIVVQNYPYLLLEGNYVGDFGERPVMIADEGHNLEQKMLEFINVLVNLDHIHTLEESKYIFHIKDIDNKPPSDIRAEMGTEEFKKKMMADQETKFPLYVDSKKTEIQKKEMMNNQAGKVPQRELKMLWIVWLKQLQIRAGKVLAHLEKLHQDLSDDRKLKSQIPECDSEENKDDALKLLAKREAQLSSLLININFFFQDYLEHPDNWVVQPHQEGQKIIKVEFKPIRIARYMKDKFFFLGDVNIIMSATIIDFKGTAKNLGIKKGEYFPISLPPVFPVESNQIYHLAAADLSYKNLIIMGNYTKEMKKMMDAIDAIINKFSDQKGIIHCNTSKIAQYIKENSQHKDRILIHNTKNRQEILKIHEENTEPSIICSPSMTEGVDLKFDKSRFQIIVKVPYLDLSDVRIRERRDQDPEYYILKTAITLCQAVGRSVRDKKDFAYTFTIDNRFEGFCRTYKKFLEPFNRHRRDIKEFEEEFGPLFPS